MLAASVRHTSATSSRGMKRALDMSSPSDERWSSEPDADTHAQEIDVRVERWEPLSGVATDREECEPWGLVGDESGPELGAEPSRSEDVEAVDRDVVMQ